MDETKLGLIASIIKFLRLEFQSGYLDPENAEGLEVAIHCLENIYDVRGVHQNLPPLIEIYRARVLEHTLITRDTTEEERDEAERYKIQGNTAMSNGKFTEALNLYSKAIECNPRNAVYYCNRAAAHSKLNDHRAAVEDCKIAILLDPFYSKAYGRLGLAYCGLELYVNALENYKKAHDLEPDNEGYSRNFELAQSKVMTLCSCNQHDHPAPGSAGNSANPNPPPNLNSIPIFNAAPTNVVNEGAIPMGQLMDMNAIFGNPQLVNIATQMLADPAMQNMMSTILNVEGGTGMQMLLQAGQRLARQMQNENPSFFNLLRQSFTEPGAQGDGNNRQEPGQEGGEPSQEKQQ